MAPSLPTLDSVRRRYQDLPAGLLDHLEGVSRLAAELAPRYGADPSRAALAGFLHDLARARDPRDLAAQAEQMGLAVDPVESAVPVLLHGPVAAAVAERELGIHDPEIVDAIACHSTGRWGMSPLEKTVFLADKLDPEKGAYYPGLEDLPQLSVRDPDGAVLAFLEWQIRRLVEQGGLVHPATVQARNWVLLQRRALLPP